MLTRNEKVSIYFGFLLGLVINIMNVAFNIFKLMKVAILLSVFYFSSQESAYKKIDHISNKRLREIGKLRRTEEIIQPNLVIWKVLG